MSTATAPLPKTITMFAPDGTLGDVPAENLQSALNAGGKVGFKIYAPDGTAGYIPRDQISAAIKAGGTFNPAQKPNSTDGFINGVGDFFGSSADALVGAAKGLYGAVTDHPASRAATALQSLAPGGNVGYNLLIKPSFDTYNTGAGMLEQARNSGNIVQGVQGAGHIIASAIPGIGPAIAGTSDAMLPQIEKGNYAGAAGTGATNALLAYLTDKAGGAVAKAITGGATVPGQNYTPSHAAAFEGMTAKANGMGPNFMPQNLTSDALSPIRQSASDMLANGSPTEQAVARTATAKGVAPLDRLGAVHTVIQKSLTDLEAQHAPVLSQVSSTPVSMSPIQSSLRSQIVPGMSAADVAGIQDLIDRSGQITNLGELNRFRQLMNEEASPSYRQTPTRAGQASAPQQVATDTADAVRAHYFDQMQQATGTDFGPLKNQESKLLTTKEAIERMQSPEAKAEATFNAGARSTKERLGDLANIIKDPRTTVTQTLLRESPATRVANLIRKSLTDLPDASMPQPQVATQVPTNASQLPASASPQVVQGTPVPPQPTAPAPASLSLINPPQLTAGVDPRLLTELSTGPQPSAPASPYPVLNDATARTRISPTQFQSPSPVAPSGARPVTPTGQVLTPIQRFLQAGDLGDDITNPSTDDLKRAISNMRKKRGK